MSIAKKALVVATLSIAYGAGVAGMPPAANAATVACGPGCIEVFSPRFGDASNPGAVETVLGGVARVGAPIGLGPASGTNTAADMMPHFGSVSQFYAAGMVSAAVNQHYGPLNAAQLEYAPSGHLTGLCVGLAHRPYPGEPLSLQPCTTPGKTVFIVDAPDSPGTAPYVPLVVGSTNDFEHPWTMTYTGKPTNSPAPRIFVSHLRSGCHGVPITQLFGTRVGVLS
jgi:hypothetical protein